MKQKSVLKQLTVNGSIIQDYVFEWQLIRWHGLHQKNWKGKITIIWGSPMSLKHYDQNSNVNRHNKNKLSTYIRTFFPLNWSELLSIHKVRSLYCLMQGSKVSTFGTLNFPILVSYKFLASNSTSSLLCVGLSLSRSCPAVTNYNLALHGMKHEHHRS